MERTDLAPLLRYWRAQDELFDRVEALWWGAVVSDPRYPAVQEPNYARVETEQPVGLAEVEEALRPALAASGARREHVVVFRPEEQSELLVEASTRGERLVWDLVMEHPGTDGAAQSDVEELAALDASFWASHRESLRWFDVTDGDVVEQLQVLERDTLEPAGRRWFGVRVNGRLTSLASLLVLEGVGFVDHVVTFPEARRRGYASALAIRAVAEATAAGAERTYLLAEPDGAARRLYAAVGFRPVTQIASWVSVIEDERVRAQRTSSGRRRADGR